MGDYRISKIVHWTHAEQQCRKYTYVRNWLWDNEKYDKDTDDGHVAISSSRWPWYNRRGERLWRPAVHMYSNDIMERPGFDSVLNYSVTCRVGGGVQKTIMIRVCFKIRFWGRGKRVDKQQTMRVSDNGVAYGGNQSSYNNTFMCFYCKTSAIKDPWPPLSVRNDVVIVGRRIVDIYRKNCKRHCNRSRGVTGPSNAVQL